MFTKEELTKMYREHYDRYNDFASKIGVNRLCRRVPVSKEELAEAYKGDTYLNNINLDLWVINHTYVNSLRKKAGLPGRGGWSIADSVCLLKHVAIHHTLGVTYEERLERRLREERAHTING